MIMLNKLQDWAIMIHCAMLRSFYIKSQKGVTMIEYALIASLVAVAAVTILGTVGTKATAVFTTVSTKLP